MIYHITTEADWMQQMSAQTFTSPSMAVEGFIHACSRDQIEGVLDRYFKSRTNLVVLEIDVQKLGSELKYEASPTGELFPHIYGVIEREAITAVEVLK
jgi:uncharacterized protein (DUF952 family)